jgi:membrane fusion protein (multidrug efflux system)
MAAVRQRSLWLQFGIVAALVAAAAGAWLQRDQIAWLAGKRAQALAPGEVAAAAVELRPARLGAVSSVIEAVGSTLANEAVAIAAKQSGIVERIHFTDGQRVKAGEVLVELGAGDLKAELTAKRAVRDNMRQIHERARRLLDSKNMSEAKVEEALAALQAAEARIKADEAKLADTVIRAPFAGRVGIRRISLGALVTPATEITTLDDTSVIKLDFDLPETVLGALKPGLAIVARSAAYPDSRFTGKVTVIGTRVDPASRAVLVRAVLANERELVKPGMFMTVSLTLGERPDAVLIAEEAVVARDDRKYVYVVRDGRAVETNVVLGRRSGAEVEVLNGVKAGEQLVVAGHQRLRDGQAVKRVVAAGS